MPVAGSHAAVVTTARSRTDSPAIGSAPSAAKEIDVDAGGAAITSTVVDVLAAA